MCQLHRAKSTNTYYVKYESNNTDLDDTIVPAQQTPYTTWVLSILGVTLVGLSGVLPLAVLPHLANNHNELSKLQLFFR
jgi:hypothetical protein